MRAAVTHPNALIPQQIIQWATTPLARALAQLFAVVSGCVLLAVAARISLPLPGTPVPLTAHTFVVLVLGATMGARLAVSSIVLYMVGAGCGLPILSGGAHGWAQLAGVTGGYLFGFILAAALMGALSEWRGLDRQVRTAWPQFFVGHTLIFLCGVAWLSHLIGVRAALVSGLLPFIPGEIIKTTLAALLVPTLRRFISPPPSHSSPV